MYSELQTRKQPLKKGLTITTQQERTKQSDDTSRRSRRMNRRKQDILKVAARLFAERGYERTTLEMIADELGLSKPGL